MRCIVAVLLLSLMVFSMLGYQKEVRADTDTQAAIGIAEELYADTPVHILELQKLDFSSMRILVGTTDETIFVDPSVIVSSYNDLYLLQFRQFQFPFHKADISIDHIRCITLAAVVL